MLRGLKVPTPGTHPEMSSGDHGSKGPGVTGMWGLLTPHCGSLQWRQTYDTSVTLRNSVIPQEFFFKMFRNGKGGTEGKKRRSEKH